MKVTQESPNIFKPVTITLETRDELKAFITILESCNFITVLGEDHYLLEAMYQLHNDLYNL